ncbi:hypothetical protein RZS08_27500, partial [Arthrospira platensis SPKY1]|nr:hypothetical protein [Arthrospira platensis SPKY1]
DGNDPVLRGARKHEKPARVLHGDWTDVAEKYLPPKSESRATLDVGTLLSAPVPLAAATTGKPPVPQ